MKKLFDVKIYILLLGILLPLWLVNSFYGQKNETEIRHSITEEINLPPPAPVAAFSHAETEILTLKMSLSLNGS